MARKKVSKKKKRITIKDVNQKLEDEINERTEITDFLIEEKNILYRRMLNEIEAKKQSTERLGNRIEQQIKQIGKVKDDLLNYSLQIVAIIVAILAIVMTLSFLSTDYYKAPEKFVWLVTFAIIYFGVIFTLWANAWRKRNKNVRQFGRNILMQTNGGNIHRNNNISITDWLQYLEHISNINTTILSSFSTSYIAILAIMLTLGIYLWTPWNLQNMGIITREILFYSILGVLLFLIAFNIWYHFCHESSKKKQLAEKLLDDIIINHKFKTIEEIEEKWKSEERRIRDSGKTKRYTYE
jgi:hypothetical protein